MSKWYSFKELKRARTPMLLDSETGLPDNHVITVVERVISVDDPELIQNNVRTDTFTLNLDAEYDDLNVVVIFTKPNNINVKVAYNGTPTHIPGSAMELVGSLACSVVGIDADGEVRAVTKAAPDTFQVVKSGAYDGSVTSDDAELLGQILQAVSDAEAAITEAETATTAATNATSQATSAATSANQAASSANSAASSANSAATKANSAAVDAQNAYDTLQPYMATIDSCANILHGEVGPDTVVTADDSFPCKPVEMTVYGNTRQNLWVNPSGTNNGVTVTANENGSITVNGTATNVSIVQVISYVLRPAGEYTLSIDKSVSSVVDCGFVVEWYKSNMSVSNVLVGYDSNLSATFTIPSDTEYCMLKFRVASGATVSGTYRVMLNEGSAAEPWCPPGLNSVGDGGSVDIVTAGKNLIGRTTTATYNSVTFQPTDDGGIRITGTNTGDDAPIAWLDFAGINSPQAWGDSEYAPIPPGNYVMSYDGPSTCSARITVYKSKGVQAYQSDVYVDSVTKQASFTLPESYYCLAARVVGAMSAENNGTVYLQLERGSAVTDFEPYKGGTTTPIDLQGHTLNALPDGTRDELHIDGGGNVVLEKRTQTATFEAGGWGIRADSEYFVYGDAYDSASLNPAAIVGLPYDNILCDKYYVKGVGNTTAPVNSIRKLDAGLNMICVVGKGTKPVDDVTVVYQLKEPQTIDLGTITPPTMAAPNVTAYVADDTPAEMELDYVRDINIVVDRLEKKVADLVVTEATIV